MAKNDYVEIMEKNHMEIPWHDYTGFGPFSKMYIQTSQS